MTLHVEVSGRGDPLVMLHGWGMHSGIWSDMATQLAQHFQVHSVDLPGHGYSRGHRTLDAVQQPKEMLDELVDILSAQFDQPIAVCGWSLGGQIAMHWAVREPEKIKRLVLVTSTPCFAERADWRFGMAQDALQQFADDLVMDHAATLRRFLGLQLRGSENERELLLKMREQLFNRGQPDPAALRDGLRILQEADLRNFLPEIKQPALVIAGERDKLSPPQASHYLVQTLPKARGVEIKGAAHVPFLSHPNIFYEHMKRFLHE